MRILTEHTIAIKGHSIWTANSAPYFKLCHNNNYSVNLINEVLGFRIIKTTKICEK